MNRAEALVGFMAMIRWLSLEVPEAVANPVC